MISFSIGVLVLTGAISIILTSFNNGIAPVPTSKKVKKELLKQLPIKPPNQVAELGAGWGTLAFSIAKKYPSAKVVAYENSVIPWIYMKIRLTLFPMPNVILMYKDFYKENLAHFDLIICYLFPGAMNKLESKFLQELTNESTIYTHTFSIPGFLEEDSWKVNDLYNTTIYRYVLKKISTSN